MSNPVPCAAMGDLRAVHDEEVLADRPLTPDVLAELLRTQGALYEYLTDAAVSGNTTQSQGGHSHGRSGGDGAYVPRFGTFYPGYLFSQNTQSDSYTTAEFELINTGGPDTSGVEQTGNRITTTTPMVYVQQDYTELRFPVLLRAQLGAAAEAKLSLIKDGVTIASDTKSTSATDWAPVVFSLQLLDTSDFSGWRKLKLEWKSDTAGYSAAIAAADERFKPLPGDIANGLGFLIGETP